MDLLLSQEASFEKLTEVGFDQDFHLFCFWSDDKNQASSIENVLSKNFTLKQTFRLNWTKEKLRENFSRLYGKSPSEDTGKQRDSNSMFYWAWLVRDETPDYKYFASNSGDVIYGNVRVKRVKEDLRIMGGSPELYLVHSSLNPQEFWRDAQLLIPVERLGLAISSSEEENVVDDLGDPLGSTGWQSIEELFGFLNRTLHYCILRPESTSKFVDYESGEIDILVTELDNLCSLANARSRSKSDPDWWREVLVGENRIVFDIREIGDGDLDLSWQRKILRDATLDPIGVFLPSQLDQFFSTVHHVATEKNPEKYLPRILPVAEGLGFVIQGSDLEKWRALLELLRGWLSANCFALSFHKRRTPRPNKELFRIFGASIVVRLWRERLLELRTVSRFIPYVILHLELRTASKFVLSGMRNKLRRSALRKIIPANYRS